MHFSTWSCQHVCFLYFGCIYWQHEPPTEDVKGKNNSSHFSVKNEGCVYKNSHSFFPQYFRQSRPLNQVILMAMLIEKTEIKIIACRVRSSQILGDWIPDYYPYTVLTTLIYLENTLNTFGMQYIHLSVNLQLYQISCLVQWSDPYRWKSLVRPDAPKKRHQRMQHSARLS